MLVKEDFFDDNNIESIINNNDSPEDLTYNDKDYQFTIEIKFNLNVTYDSIKSFENGDKIYQEVNRLFKYIKKNMIFCCSLTNILKNIDYQNKQTLLIMMQN